MQIEPVDPNLMFVWGTPRSETPSNGPCCGRSLVTKAAKLATQIRSGTLSNKETLQFKSATFRR